MLSNSDQVYIFLQDAIPPGTCGFPCNVSTVKNISQLAFSMLPQIEKKRVMFIPTIANYFADYICMHM